MIEAMLACALGFLLLSGLLQIYFSVKKSFDLQQAIATLQQNGRFATNFLSQNIRLAGDAYCGDSAVFVTPDAIVGYGDHVPGVLSGKVLKNTDSLIVGLCRQYRGQVTFDQFAFFVGKTTRQTKSGKTINALYIMPVDGEKRELVSDVDSMVLRYGVKSDQVITYLSQDQVKDWHQVVSVELALLLSSELPVLYKPQSYVFAEKKWPPSRFLHREWDIYIALRQRL